MQPATAEQPRVPLSVYAGIFCCSMGVLMLQILLTRIFSFSIWYHLAYLTVSTAMLGFGISGSVLSAWPRLNEGRARLFWTICTSAAGVTALAALYVLAPRPLDPADMYLAPGRFFWGLLGYYAILAVPFTLAGVGVSGPLTRYPHRASALYAVDLLGAGSGCLGAVMALNTLDGPSAAVVCCGLLLASAAMYADVSFLRRAFGIAAIAVVGGSATIGATLTFQPSPSKALGRELAMEGTKILHTEWSAVNRVDVYRTGYPMMNFWSDVGRNPNFKGPFPFGINIVYDADNGSNAFRASDPAELAVLDEHILRTPYLLLDAPEVMVIGVGGGVDVVNALRRGAARIVGVELQPITVRLHAGLLAEWIGGAMQRPEVTLVAAEGRHYARSSEDIYDLIQITATDTFSAQSTGAYVLAESYLYTEEAMRDFLGHLRGDGVLSLTLGDVVYNDDTIPPALATRLCLTAMEALRDRGVSDPASHLMYISQDYAKAHGKIEAAMGDQKQLGTMFRGTQIGNVLIRNRPFTEDEIQRVSDFADANGFAVELAPGRETGRKISAIVNTPEDRIASVLAQERVAVYPLTDDRPFFYHVQRWGALFAGAQTLWMFPGSTTGQLVLLMILVQAVVVGSVLITVPLLRGARQDLSGSKTFRFLLYFLALGIGFMFIEISFVQKYVLLLGYPTYSLSVTIASLLVFAALGAALSPLGWRSPRRLLLMALGLTVMLGLAEIMVMPAIRESFLGTPLWMRIGLTFAMQGPMGAALGLYFATGIEIIRTAAPRLVPWAWAVNGVGSVTSSVLAVILAMGIGFSGVTLAALLVYGVGVASMISTLTHPQRPGPAASVSAT